MRFGVSDRSAFSTFRPNSERLRADSIDNVAAAAAAEPKKKGRREKDREAGGQHIQSIKAQVQVPDGLSQGLPPLDSSSDRSSRWYIWLFVHIDPFSYIRERICELKLLVMLEDVWHGTSGH